MCNRSNRLHNWPTPSSGCSIPVLVSPCTRNSTVGRFDFKPSSMLSNVSAIPFAAFNIRTLAPYRWAMSAARCPHNPMSPISTVSSRSIKLLNDASMPPWPDVLKHRVILFCVWKMYRQPSLISSIRAYVSGHVGPINGRHITFSTRWLTVDGPVPTRIRVRVFSGCSTSWTGGGHISIFVSPLDY